MTPPDSSDGQRGEFGAAGADFALQWFNPVGSKCLTLNNRFMQRVGLNTHLTLGLCGGGWKRKVMENGPLN